ncbi:hypothetical protein DM02DRAFT_625399 [Periconia macrospinosa]|uniref:C2H2-type domain-containing protein n=1 Tax=Periconia macrospinosa TaxID=97972 RepID=A0A2V1E0D4_9PLEO|nr:hypothetical protein DM02DRAFT_625399 [Periconia macrospinosa]
MSGTNDENPQQFVLPSLYDLCTSDGNLGVKREDDSCVLHSRPETPSSNTMDSLDSLNTLDTLDSLDTLDTLDRNISEMSEHDHDNEGRRAIAAARDPLIYTTLEVTDDNNDLRMSWPSTKNDSSPSFLNAHRMEQLDREMEIMETTFSLSHSSFSYPYSPPLINKTGDSHKHPYEKTNREESNRYGSGLPKSSDISANPASKQQVAAKPPAYAYPLQREEGTNSVSLLGRDSAQDMYRNDSKPNPVTCTGIVRDEKAREATHNSDVAQQYVNLPSQSLCQEDSPGDTTNSPQQLDSTHSNSRNEKELRERQGSEENRPSPCESCASGNPKFDMSDSDVEWVLSNALGRIKRILLEELVSFAEADPTDGSGGSGSRKRTREPSPPPSSSPSLESFTRRPQKRSRRTEKKFGDDGESDENKEQNEKSQKPSIFTLRRLRCPFNQREPEKFVRPACRGGGFSDIAKLKDHIKRVHLQPLRCPRCWEEMESDEACIAHLQAKTICPIKSEPVDDRLPRQILKRLDFKKTPYAKSKDTEEKWRIMYSVLFPDDTQVPSPYSQNSFTPRLQQILHDALEEELIKKMTPAFEPIVEEIKRSIPSIIENYRARLLQADSETPISFAASSREDPEGDGRHQQMTSPPTSDTSTSQDVPQSARNAPPHHDDILPVDTNFHGLQQSYEALSPVIIPGSESSSTSAGCRNADYQVQDFSRISQTFDYQSPYPPIPDDVQQTFPQVEKAPCGSATIQSLEAVLQSQLPTSIGQSGQAPLDSNDMFTTLNDFSTGTELNSFSSFLDFDSLPCGIDFGSIEKQFYDP